MEVLAIQCIEIAGHFSRCEMVDIQLEIVGGLLIDLVEKTEKV
jgi:hypothetical protein